MQIGIKIWIRTKLLWSLLALQFNTCVAHPVVPPTLHALQFSRGHLACKLYLPLPQTYSKTLSVDDGSRGPRLMTFCKKNVCIISVVNEWPFSFKQQPPSFWIPHEETSPPHPSWQDPLICFSHLLLILLNFSEYRLTCSPSNHTRPLINIINLWIASNIKVVS